MLTLCATEHISTFVANITTYRHLEGDIFEHFCEVRTSRKLWLMSDDNDKDNINANDDDDDNTDANDDEDESGDNGLNS